MGGRIIPVEDDYEIWQEYANDFYGELDQGEVQVIVGDNASAAYVKYGGLLGIGDAKRNKGERRNADVGQDLALGRAFINLGNQMVARALETLDCQEA